MKNKSLIDTVIKIPENISLEKNISSSVYTITGPLGSSTLDLKKLDRFGSACINIDTINKQVIVRSFHPSYNGLYKQLIENKFIGVSRGFCIYLDIVGVGYRASLISSESVVGVRNKINQVYQDSVQPSKEETDQGSPIKDTIVLKLGHSHDIHYKVPSGVRVFLQSPSEICLFGVDLNQVSQVAHSIRNTRPPSIYKGKGIRLSNENITTRTGKRK
ncbi:rml6 (mitochondrion) [Auxenochlorella protothecoides x Auxenochlorella symbiontica]